MNRPPPPGVLTPAEFEQLWIAGRRDFEGVRLDGERPFVTVKHTACGWRAYLVWPSRPPFDLCGRPYTKDYLAEAIGRRHADDLGLDFVETPS